MSGNFNGRAARLVAWLGERPNGARLAELFRLEAALNPHVTASQVSASLVQLHKKHKIARSGLPHHYVYTLPGPKPAAKRPASPASGTTSTGSIVIGPGPSFRQSLTADELAADVAAFQRNGGRVQQLAMHEASKPFERLFRDDPQPSKPARKHTRAAAANSSDDLAA